MIALIVTPTFIQSAQSHYAQIAVFVIAGDFTCIHHDENVVTDK